MSARFGSIFPLVVLLLAATSRSFAAESVAGGGLEPKEDEDSWISKLSRSIGLG